MRPPPPSHTQMNNLSAHLFACNCILVKCNQLYVGALNLNYLEEDAAGF